MLYIQFIVTIVTLKLTTVLTAETTKPGLKKARKPQRSENMKRFREKKNVKGIG